MLGELTRERTLPIIEALTHFIEERQAEGEVRGDVPASEIIIAGMSMVAYPFVEEGMFAVVMPALVVRDEAALERRKEAIIKLLMDAIRPPRKRR